MPNESCRVSGVIPATPEVIYVSWLDSRGHTEMTGGTAEIAAEIGRRFTAWDGYIEGVNLELEPGRRIVQAWRSTEFPTSSPDSRIEVLLEPVEGGTLVTIVHSEIPEGQGAQYESGWHEHYLIPMKAFFGRVASRAKAPRKRPAPSRKAASKTRASPRRKASGRKKVSRTVKKSRSRSRR